MQEGYKEICVKSNVYLLIPTDGVHVTNYFTLYSSLHLPLMFDTNNYNIFI
jgi:hypothetical protein